MNQTTSLWNRTGFSFSRIKMARLSAAKARVSGRAARDERTAWQRFVRVCTAIAAFWKELAAFVLSVASVCAVAIIIVLLWKALTQKTIAVAPIAVPRMLAENGYTADVAAQRLHDTLNKFVEDAQTRWKAPEVALQADLPSIVVPAIGLSLETIAADIRTFFYIARRSNISGELTIVQKQLWLRLRMNGQDFFTSPNGVDPEHPDELFATAAEKVFELADPPIAASSLSERDPGKSLEIARQIIASRPETDQSVPWAHTLVAYILSRQHKTDEAITEFRKAIELDPRYALPHYNLGVALREQGKTEEAIAEYRKAIELDPRDASPHYNLGNALHGQHKTEEAIAEYRKAIELDPRLALAHNNLGIALSSQGKTEEASAEYRKALELDPRDADSRHNLAAILLKQGKTKEADAEDQKAKALGAKHPD